MDRDPNKTHRRRSSLAKSRPPGIIRQYSLAPAVRVASDATSLAAAIGAGSQRHLQPTLLQRVAEGDSSAVQESIDAFGGLVWSLARRFCRERADAEDAVQEIFVDLWRSAPRYDPAVASESTFVGMIARRRLIDRVRRQGRRLDPGALPEADVAARPAGHEERLEVAEDAARAVAAMKSLSAEQQRVLQLSVMQGRSHSEIAQITGLPLGTVKTHARRGLMRIRELLEARPGAGSAAEARP